MVRWILQKSYNPTIDDVRRYEASHGLGPIELDYLPGKWFLCDPPMFDMSGNSVTIAVEQEVVK